MVGGVGDRLQCVASLDNVGGMHSIFRTSASLCSGEEDDGVQ